MVCPSTGDPWGQLCPMRDLEHMKWHVSPSLRHGENSAAGVKGNGACAAAACVRVLGIRHLKRPCLLASCSNFQTTRQFCVSDNALPFLMSMCPGEATALGFLRLQQLVGHVR